MSKTLILLKPDCLQKKLVKKVLAIFEKAGLKVVKKTKSFKPSKKTISQIYSPLRKKPFIKAHINFVSSGKCVLAMLEGKNALRKARAIIGHANPKKARKGTIRARFGSVSRNDVYRNIVHSPDSSKEFKRELRLFKKEL